MCVCRTIAPCLRNELRKTVFRAYLLFQLFWDQIFPYIHLVLEGTSRSSSVDLTTKETCPMAGPAWRRTGRSLPPFLLFGGVVALRSQLRVGPHRMSAWGQSEQPLPSPQRVPLCRPPCCHLWAFLPIAGSPSVLQHPPGTVVSLHSPANHSMVKSLDEEVLPAFSCAHSTPGHGRFLNL